jgi:putative acetyltransferase
MHHYITNEEIESLRQAARIVVRELGLLGEAYFDIGVTLAERHLLIELDACLYPNVGDIAERLLLDKSTASRLVAKAVKKGLVAYAIDERDKRRRCLQLTEKGRQTLHAIEPIAQQQVKNALLMLSEEETQAVYRGVALFAKGLNKARLRKEFTIDPIAAQDNVPLAHLILSILKEQDSKAISLALQDMELQAMYETYQQQGKAYFVIRKGAKIVGGAGIAPLRDKKVGVCELRKICLATEARGLGLDDLLIQACLKEAQQQGYRTCYIKPIFGITQMPDLYLRHGFVPLVHGDSADDDLFFEKTF